MARRPALFTQADLARALRAAKAAGVRVRVRLLPDGSMEVATGEDAPQPEVTPVDQKPARVLI